MTRVIPARNCARDRTQGSNARYTRADQKLHEIKRLAKAWHKRLNDTRKRKPGVWQYAARCTRLSTYPRVNCTLQMGTESLPCAHIPAAATCESSQSLQTQKSARNHPAALKASAPLRHLSTPFVSVPTQNLSTPLREQHCRLSHGTSLTDLPRAIPQS